MKIGLKIVLVGCILLSASNTYATGEAGLESELVGYSLVYKVICDREIPGYAEKSHTAYQKWRQAKHDLIIEIEPNIKKHVASLKLQNQEIPPRTEAKEAELQVACSNLLAEFKSVNKIVDDRFSTPEKTWQLFVSALSTADKKMAIECLTPTMQNKFKPMITKMTNQQLAEMAESFITFSLLKAPVDSKYREAAVSRANNQAGIIAFYNAYGEWKIAEM